MSIQGSVNQLLGISSLVANAIKGSTNTDKERALKDAQTLIDRSSAPSDVKEKILSERMESDDNIIANLKSIKNIKETPDMVYDIENNADDKFVTLDELDKLRRYGYTMTNLDARKYHLKTEKASEAEKKAAKESNDILNEKKRKAMEHMQNNGRQKVDTNREYDGLRHFVSNDGADDDLADLILNQQL